MEIIESVQYKAALCVTGCWKGTNRIKLYEELGWESLSDRRWAHRLTIFYKIKNALAPSYLSDHIPVQNDFGPNLRHRRDRVPFTRTDRFSNSFFPFTIKLSKHWRN